MSHSSPSAGMSVKAVEHNTLYLPCTEYWQWVKKKTLPVCGFCHLALCFPQYLGYQDFWLLSRHSPARRKELYSLTELGGHPYQWNTVSAICLATLQDFTRQVTEFNCHSLGGGPVTQLSQTAAALTPLQKGNRVFGPHQDPVLLEEVLASSNLPRGNRICVQLPPSG